MTSSLTKSNSEEYSTSSDPFIFDTEKMLEIASDTVIKDGLQYFNEKRVTEMVHTTDELCALVEGTDTDIPYTTELFFSKNNILHVMCDCGAAETICKHGIALLYHYAMVAGETNSDVVNALDEAIEERVKKGKNEVNVEQVSGSLRYGTWTASSITSATHRPQTYQVQIRFLDQRNNDCSCPDLATNQLGTCKHIEAVLHHIRKQPEFDTIKSQQPEKSFIYQAWDVPGAPLIKAYRSPKETPNVQTVLNRYFGANNFFKGSLPEDFYQFSDILRGEEGLEIGNDVTRYVNRLATDLSHQEQSRKIRQQITQSGGILPGVKARLYPYQVEGVAFLAATGRCLLADDMGLGKTLQSIAAASWLAQNSGLERVLIICPASLKQQWAREINKFSDFTTQIIQGNPEAREAQYRKKRTFIIVNYELVLRDLTVINTVLQPDLIILDEAQRIKNWRTKIASTIKLIPSQYVFVLSGTPLENRLEDLYSLMQVVNPHILGPLWRYLLDFHVTDERGKVLGYRNLSELRKRFAPVLLRRDRSLVSDQLPERIQTRLDVPMTHKQQELHDNALSAAGSLAQIAKKRPLTPSEQNRLMSALQTARMSCNAAGLVDKQTSGSPKLDEMANLFDDLCLQNGQKVVVFSQWERMTAMVEQLLNKLKIGCVRLHGGVPTAKRGDLMDKFRNDDSVQVFVSTDAGGVGLNLQSGSALINIDIPWNPAVLEQRIARVHRLGQKKKVQVILLVAANSYENDVMHLVKGKQHLFDNVINPDAEEDVVGVSPKMLETLLENLDKKDSEKKANAKKLEELSEPQTISTADQENGKSDDNPEAREAIIEIQSAFGSRIERIMGTGGGLLVIMTPIDAQDEEHAILLSEKIPVALMEPRTFAGLSRLGANSPIGETTPLFEAVEQPSQKPISPLIAASENKLSAAELLVDQGNQTVALELLISAMLSVAAVAADIPHPPSIPDAPVWIYTELIPNGCLQPDQANVIVRAISLTKAVDIPVDLIKGILEDTRILIEQIRIVAETVSKSPTPSPTVDLSK